VFELATGVPLGIKDINDKKFTPGSALDIIAKKLESMEFDRMISEKNIQDKVNSKGA
jgi:hypothetical protein